MSTSIYQQVNDICRTLVTTCLTALEKLQLGNDGKSFLICARKATSENVRLVCFIKDYPTECGVEKDELVQQTLLVRDVVVKLIVTLRSMHHSPGSTLTAGNTSATAQHHVTLLRNELKIAMKKVGMAAHQLSLAEAGITRPAVRSSGHQPTQEDYNPEVGPGGGPGAGVGGNCMVGGAVMGYLVYEQYAIDCLDALSQIPEAVRRRNREEFTTSTRNAINLVNKLISFRRSNASVDNRVELRQNLVSLISHSKMYFVNPDDEVFKQKFVEFKENVENAVKSYLPQGYVHTPQPPPDAQRTEDSENFTPVPLQDSSEGLDRARKSALPVLEMVHEDFEGSREPSDSIQNSRNSSRTSPWRSVYEITEGTRESDSIRNSRNSRTRNYHRTVSTDSDIIKDPEAVLNDSLQSPEKPPPIQNSLTSKNTSVVTEGSVAGLQPGSSPREPTSWKPLGEPFLGKTYKSPTLNGREEEEEGKFRLFGTHRRGGDVMFDSRALSEVLDDEDEDDDFESEVTTENSIISEYDPEILENESSVHEFSQSIVDKVKTTCPNDWEQLDAENKELFEKHIRMVLNAHKRLILATHSHSVPQSRGHTRTIPRTIMHTNSNPTLTQSRSKPPKTPRLVPSVPNLLKPSKNKPPRDPRDPDIVRQKENFLKQISEITCSLLGDMYTLVVHFNDTAPALEKSGKTETRDKTKDGNFRKKIMSHSKKLFQFIKESAEIIKDVPKHSTLEKVKQRVTNEINLGLEKESTVLPIDSSLLARGQYCRYNKQCLLAAIYGHMDSILNMASQFVSTLRGCDVLGVRVNDSSDDQQAFTLLISCSAFYGLLVKSLDDIATYYYLLQEEEKLKKSPQTDKGKKTVNENSIWNEPTEDPSDPTKDLNRPGTLSALIIRLTSSIFSAEHLNAFLSGYELFTTPVQVWEKLEDRYMVPKSALQNEQAQFVKMRCANVMLHWLKKDLHSISVGTLTHIERFASTTLSQDKFTNISSLILSELESPGRFEVKLDKSPSRELKVSEDLQQILSMEDKVTIAEQLTIIDFQIYEKISYVELTDLKWNESKEKLHIMARNVLNFIRRSNYLALFVATNILLQKKLKDRVKLLIRFVGIAKCLADMHNYNSLMGILVGLGQASIDRLKLTWGKLASKHIDTYRMLQQYFNPGNAFKLLREKLKASGGNALPYMGCILGDLTFMDEGNPNYIMEGNIKLINFPKHLLINRAITELQQFQKTRYNFTLKEPLYTFLHQMPILQDRELFALSLEREPRNPT